MRKSQPSNIPILLFVSASILGLLSLALLTIGSSASSDVFSLRKPLIGAIFMLICILGASAVILPNTCNSILGADRKSGGFGFHSAPKSGRPLQGHHFDCEGYVSHTFRFGGKTLCAACSGLFLGAVVSVLGSVAYFFLNVSTGQFGLVLLVIGIGLVVLGFAQFKFPGLIRLLINALFVFGAFLVLFAMDTLLKNLFTDLYVISLILLWILTRILLSQWDHSRICRSCTVDCELKK